MRYRMTVCDAATGLRQDVHVECEPGDPVGGVLDMISQALPVNGLPAVHGGAVDPAAAVTASGLRDGAVLEYGGGATAGADPFIGRRDGYVLRVVSGPSAGRGVALRTGQALEIGRSAEMGLVLADPDVSRRHAVLRGRSGGFEIVDRDSANGVLVGGQRITGPHALGEGEVVQLGGSRLVVEDDSRSGAAITRAEDGAYLLNRRFPDRRAPFEPPTIALPTPLPDDESRGIPLLAMFLPLVLAVAMALLLRSPMYLLFGLLSPVMMGGNWWSERRRRRVRDRRQRGSYADKLAAARARIAASLDDEDADLRARMPDPATVVRSALELRRDLWSRRGGEDGWLVLRVGTADRPASVLVTGERPVDWTEPVVNAVPVGVALEDVAVLGVAGPPAGLRARIGWLLTQCAVLHSADELQIAVLAPEARDDELGWARWLPHARTPGGEVRAAWDDAAVDQLVRRLGDEVDRRAADPLAPPEKVVGRMVVVLVGAGALVRRPPVAELLARGPSVGLRFVCADHDERLLPDTCHAVLAATGDRWTLRVDRGAETPVHVDELPAGTEERVARTLAPLRRVGDAPAAGLPAAVRFTDVVSVPDREGLRAAWRLEPERSHVVVGRDADGLFGLDIAAGPHAVVAGTSGAGKSELLQTWVAALALANTPETLSIVFMDYKGGAAFRDLAGLPHVVGTVTNLDERLAVRALLSLRAELTRRQEQLRKADAVSRAEYLRRRQGDPTLAPFPRLVVVVDELAELKERLPMLVEELVGVARTGRSLGMHLVLATQKPAGVVDTQIRANVNLRICLRTRDEGESMDVIEIGDAARIPIDRPGRALIGWGGPVAKLVQTAQITTPSAAGSRAAGRVLALPWTAVAVPAAPSSGGGLRTDLHDIVDVVAAAAAAEGLVAPYRPWTDPLPDLVLLTELPTAAGTLPIGLADRPAEQRQEPLAVALGSGHLGVFGSGRTGRTSVLRALAAGVARAHPPSVVHVHAVDGARGLAGLVALPHVGVVADDEDPERLERLLTRLAEEVRSRRRLLAERGATGLAELGPDAPPAILLLVDDWLGVLETEGAGPLALQELLGGGAAAAGVTVCLAGDERLLRGRVLNRLDHRLCLRLNNPAEATALGLHHRNLPDGLPPGRGLWAADGCEVQVPLLAEDRSGSGQSRALAALAAELRCRDGEPGVDRAPMRLDPLPTRIGLAAASALPTLGHGDVRIGVSGDRLSAVLAPLDPTYPMLIAGPSRSGRSTAAASIAAGAAAGGAVTLLVAPRPAEAHRAAADRGVVLVTPAELAAALDTHGPSVVVVDDADTADLDDALVAGLTEPGGPALVVAAQLDAFGFGSRGLVLAAKKKAGPVVLLCPPNHLAAENVGVRIERGAGFTGPAGRALLVVDGEVRLGQVADVRDAS